MADSTTERAVPDEGAASPRLQDVLTAHFNISGGWHTWSCACGADAQDELYRGVTHPEHQVAMWQQAAGSSVVLTDEQEHQAASYLQDQTAIASIGLCRTFVRGMVRRVNEVRGAGL